MNHWKFATRATIASKYDVQAILLGSSAGLMATAYSQPGGSVLLNTQVVSHDDIQQSLNLSPRPQLYVLYAGYFFATRSGAYTFQLLKHSALNETIRMTIGGFVFFEIVNGTTCNSTSARHCNVTATCILESPGNMYHVGVEYSRQDSSVLGGNFSLRFRYQDSLFMDMMAYILPTIGSKPDALDISVSSSVPQAASSFASGNCLTIATAGTACQFTISARDEFGSPSDFLSNFSILCTSFVDNAQVSSIALTVNNSTLKVSYVPSIAGVHTLSLFHLKSILQWTLLVMPAPSAAAQRSFVQGIALTLATAGSQAKFTVFAMDQYGNLLERANNIAVIVEKDDRTEHHSLSVEAHRAMNSMVFKEMTSSYRITASGRYRISVAALESGLLVSMRSKSAISETYARAEYLTFTDDISLQFYHNFSRNLYERSNATFSEISFSGFISPASSGIFTFRVLTPSTSDVVSLSIDRIKLYDSNFANDAVPNGYFLAALDSSSLNDAVLKINWPETSNWDELWLPPASAFTFSGEHNSCSNAAGAMINGNDGWCNSISVAGGFMIIDFGRVTPIFGVATQGRANSGQWVTQFSLASSSDKSTWAEHGSFQGNADANTIVKSSIVPPVNARYIRITVQQFNGWSSMRAGLFLARLVDSATNSMIFRGTDSADAGSNTWNVHTSGFSITAQVMLNYMTSDQTLLRFFNSTESLKFNIILEFVKSGAAGFDIRFLIYNDENDEINSGCTTSPSETLRHSLNTKYIITAAYDAAAKVSKIYVDGLLRKQCPTGVNVALGPRNLKFSYLGRDGLNVNKYFVGEILRLAIYDRLLVDAQVLNQHQTLKGFVPAASIALVGSSLYEFQMNFSSINFSRVGVMVRFCSTYFFINL
jgi:hypothetical protein